MERQGKTRTRERDRTAAEIEDGDEDGEGNDDGDDGGAKAKTGMGPGVEADGAARTGAKTRGRKEARETEEGTTDDEMIRACEAAEEQAAAGAVTGGDEANAKVPERRPSIFTARQRHPMSVHRGPNNTTADRKTSLRVFASAGSSKGKGRSWS